MTEQPASRYPWLHMIAIAIGYAILIFFCCVLIGPTRAWSIYVAYAFLIPVLFVFGFWSALGANNICLRVIVFSLLGPLLFVAGVAGLATDSMSVGIFFDDETSWLTKYYITLMFTFSLCVACQVPFWILRFVFGWQLIDSNRNWIEKKPSIRDIFFLTAVFAVAFALPRFAANMYFDATVNQIRIGYTEYVESDESDELGAPQGLMKAVIVTEENIDELREARREQFEPFRADISVGVIFYSIPIAGVALLFAPAVWMTLRRSGTGQGVCMATLYLALLYVVGTVLINLIFVGAGFVNWTQLIPSLAGFCVLFVIAAMLPLLVSRRLGIRLANNRDFREQRNEHANGDLSPNA